MTICGGPWRAYHWEVGRGTTARMGRIALPIKAYHWEVGRGTTAVQRVKRGGGSAYHWEVGRGTKAIKNFGDSSLFLLWALSVRFDDGCSQESELSPKLQCSFPSPIAAQREKEENAELR